MIILMLRTDKPEAEIGVFSDHETLGYEMWEAHRELSATIHAKIQSLLGSVGKDWKDVEGVVFYLGPGSFTGLRIGAAVANTVASALGIPIVGTNGADWKEAGVQQLRQGVDRTIVIPFYGRDPHITAPRK